MTVAKRFNALLAGIGFSLRLLLREVAFLFSYSMDLSMKSVRDVSENFLLTSSEKSYWGCIKSPSSSDFARTKVHLEHPKALYILPNDLKMTL